MRKTVYWVNDKGLAQIAQILSENHRHGKEIAADKFKCVSWAQEAEEMLNNGEEPFIEIGAFDSVRGRAELFALSRDGFTAVEIDT